MAEGIRAPDLPLASSLTGAIGIVNDGTGDKVQRISIEDLSAQVYLMNNVEPVNLTLGSLTVAPDGVGPSWVLSGTDTDPILNMVLPSSNPPTYNASDIGYDVFLLVGQSNMLGNGTEFDAILDAPDPRVFMRPVAGASANTIVPAAEPMNHNGTAMTGPPVLIGPGIPFGRAYARTVASNRNVLLVPMASNGTSFTGASWNAAARFAEIVCMVTRAGVAGDTAEINGTLITLVSSGATGNQINIGATPEDTADNLRTFINANTVALGVNAGARYAGTFGVNNWPMFVITANTIGVPSPPILTRRTVGTTFLFGGASSTNLGGGSNGVASRVTQSVSAANAAIAAGANNRIVGILWGQGEADATMSAARYQSELIDLINYFRANITGATNCPFVIGGMVPEWVATSTQAQQIDSVHRNLPASASVLRVGFADPPIGSADPTPFHYDAPSARRLGAQYYLGWLRAVGNTVSGFPAQPTSVEATAVTSSSISISWARPTSGVTRITSWLIRRRIAGGGVWTNTTAVFSATTATITGLSPNTQYEIQVIGVNAQGNGTPSNTLLATTSP